MSASLEQSTQPRHREDAVDQRGACFDSALKVNKQAMSAMNWVLSISFIFLTRTGGRQARAPGDRSVWRGEVVKNSQATARQEWQAESRAVGEPPRPLH